MTYSPAEVAGSGWSPGRGAKLAIDARFSNMGVMMRRKIAQRLILNMESIRVLAGTQLRLAAGGVPRETRGDSCTAACGGSEDCTDTCFSCNSCNSACPAVCPI